MTLRRRGGLGGCDPRTQGASIAALLGRPRTPWRAVQHVPAAQGFILRRALSHWAVILPAGRADLPDDLTLPAAAASGAPAAQSRAADSAEVACRRGARSHPGAL